MGTVRPPLRGFQKFQWLTTLNNGLSFCVLDRIIMKTQIVITSMALAGLVALPAAAQDQPKPKPQPGKLQLQVRPAVIGGAFALRGPKLNLTDDQKKSLADIRKERGQTFRELYQDKNLTREERLKESKKLREAFQEQTDAVYTKEQRAQLAKFRAEQKKRIEELRKNGKGPGFRVIPGPGGGPGLRILPLRIQPGQIKPLRIRPGVRPKPAQPKPLPPKPVGV